MNKEEFLYRVKYLVYHPLITVKTKKHTLIIRALKDDLGKLYGDKILRYDVVIDDGLGPDAENPEEFLQIFKRNPELQKYLPLLKIALEKLEVIVCQ